MISGWAGRGAGGRPTAGSTPSRGLGCGLPDVCWGSGPRPTPPHPIPPSHLFSWDTETQSCISDCLFHNHPITDRNFLLKGNGISSSQLLMRAVVVLPEKLPTLRNHHGAQRPVPVNFLPHACQHFHYLNSTKEKNREEAALHQGASYSAALFACRVTPFLAAGGSRLLLASGPPRSPVRPSSVLSAGAAPPVRGAGG